LSAPAGGQSAAAVNSKEAFSQAKTENDADPGAGDAAIRAETGQSNGAAIGENAREKPNDAAADRTEEENKEKAGDADKENVPSGKAADKAEDKEGDTEGDDKDAEKESKRQDDDADADADDAGDAKEPKAAEDGKDTESKKDEAGEKEEGDEAPGDRDVKAADDDDDDDDDDTGGDVNKDKPDAAGGDDKSFKDGEDAKPAADKPNGKDYNDVNYYDTNKDVAESHKDTNVDKELIPVAYDDQDIDDNDDNDKNADYMFSKQDRELGERQPGFDDDDDDDDDDYQYDTKTGGGDNDVGGVDMHGKAAGDDVKFDEHDDGESELPSKDNRRSDVFRSTLLRF